MMCGAAALLLLLTAVTQPMRADDAEAFYKGKTIELYVGFFVGAGYDQRGRLLARYMGRYIPGNPLSSSRIGGRRQLEAGQLAEKHRATRRQRVRHDRPRRWLRFPVRQSGGPPLPDPS